MNIYIFVYSFTEMENTDSTPSNSFSSCENTCSKHNALRTINYQSYGVSFIPGMYQQCECKCSYCIMRETEFNDSIKTYYEEYKKNG